MYGGEGDDSLSDHEGTNTLNGGGGNDTISAGEGENTLIGGEGNDVLYLTGGVGNNTLPGPVR